MKGRLENTLKRKQSIQRLLKDMPDYVTDYYYKIQASTESLTCYIYLGRIKHFLETINKDISKVNETDIGKYLEKLSCTTDKNGNIRRTSHSYEQQTWTILNQFFEYLQYKNIVDKNPVSVIKRSRKKDVIERKFLSMDDLNKILDAAYEGAGNSIAKARQAEWKERDVLILFLFMSTGVRKTAVSEINIDDVSIENHCISVIDKRDKVHNYILTNDMEEILIKWLIKREKLLNGKRCDALFISKNMERLSANGVYDIVKKYSKEALGYSISPHKLRSAFISLYYEASGHDIDATREAVGHTNVATTSRYIVRENNARAEAAAFMSSNLSRR